MKELERIQRISGVLRYLVLIGALASAEERHMGTLGWQTMLPVAAWQQLAVKTAVALTLSLLLAFALPLLLARGELPITGLHAGAVLVLTIGSLFVFFNLCVDLLCGVINPKVRLE